MGHLDISAQSASILTALLGEDAVTAFEAETVPEAIEQVAVQAYNAGLSATGAQFRADGSMVVTRNTLSAWKREAGGFDGFSARDLRDLAWSAREDGKGFEWTGLVPDLEGWTIPKPSTGAARARMRAFKAEHANA